MKKALLILLSAVFVGCCVALGACSNNNNNNNNNDNDSNKYDGLFAGESHNYVLDADYKLTDADVKGTEGNDNVTLGYICTFNLGGHTLDLGGYTLNVTSNAAEVVKFENGKIKNGALNISVPKGDIEFRGTDIDESVTYELEAASETIRFSNAKISGQCTVKSNTNVSVEYSNVNNITLSGNGTLTAGNGAELGAVKVSENASGATVNVSPSATVSNMELHAAANVSVAGNVASVKVAETAKNDSANLSITIAETASVDKVELNAAASVSVAGNVSSVKVAETAKNSNANLSITIAETATVDKVELNAAASVSVAGSVQAVTVSESAKSDSAQLTINVADTADVARVELNAPASVEVSGGVSNIVVANSAGGSSVKLNETASVTTVAVNASDTKIDSNANASVSKVVVAESVKNSVTSNVEVTTATEEEMQDYLKHQHVLVVVSRDEATCTKTGKIHYSCECGEKSEKTIPALGHKYVYSVIKEPTESEKGQGLYRCSRCGDEYTVELVHSVSVVIDGLEYLFSVIPDGTYSIAVDKANPITITHNKEGSVTVKQMEAIVEVDGGKLSGTFNGVINVAESKDEYSNMQFKAIIENNIVYASFSLDESNNYHSYKESGSIYASLSALIKMALAQFLPIDVEELTELLPYLDNIEDGEISLPLNVISKIVDGITTKTTQNGNTVYTFDSKKLVASLNALGKKTLDVLIDDVLGEGAFKAISDFTDGLADKTVKTVLFEVYALTEKFGISEDILFEIVQTVLDEVLPDAEINVAELITGYYDKTVAATVAEIMGDGTTAAQVKQTIETTVENILGLCSKTTFEDVVNMLLEMVADGGSGQPDYDYPNNGGATNPDYGVTEKPVEYTEEDSDGFTYKTLLDMLSVYADNLTLSVTLNSSNKLVAFNIAYIDESGIKISISKTADSAIPVIDIDVMGVKVAVDKTDKGAEAIVNVMGVTATVTADKTNTGAELHFTVVMEDVTVADLELVITAKKDAQNNIYGAEFEVNGDITIPSQEEESVVISGKVTAEKNDKKQLDTSVWDSFGGDKSAYYKMDVTMPGSTYKNDTAVSLKYVKDESGEYYLLTKTVLDFVASGSVYETVSTARLLSFNGLPEIMFEYSNDCTDWVKLSLMHYALAEVTCTELKGGTPKLVNGVYVIENAVRGETESLGTNATEFHGACYYNIKTGEVASESKHDYVYTGKYAEGSTQCSDGTLITSTCSVCKTSSTMLYHSHYYIENKTELKTQCDENSYLSAGECVVCHYKQLSDSLYGHSTHNVYKQIVSEEEYNEILQYTDTEKYDISENYVKITDLAEYGFATEGFYHGDLTLSHCAICGLNVYKYTYYTYTQADKCLRHTAYVVEYKGNVDFESFEYKTELSTVGHYAPTSSKGEYQSVTVAINEAKQIIGGDLPFTPNQASYRENQCLGCGIAVSKTIYLYNTNINAYLELSVSYTNGKVSGWNYHGEAYDLQTALNEAIKLELAFSEAIDGQVWYSASYNGSEYLSINLSDEEKNSLHVNKNIYSDNNGYMEVSYYYYKQCTQLVDRYKLSDGKWTLYDSRNEERHDIISDYISGDNCREDGYYYFNGCIVCGYSDDRSVPNFDHYLYGGSYTNYIGEYEYWLAAETGLSGLEASLSFNCRCYDCETLIGVTIVLNADWTLQSDVYIKAEDLTLDLNGYTIDLNGYSLVLYSYAGEALIVTDNTFNTETQESDGMITNTKDDGVLVLDTYLGELVLGTIEIDKGVTVLPSDCVERYDLFDYVKSEGYELPFLKAERPSYPQM